MLISYCNGSTSLDFFLRIASSSLASASSRSVTTSLSACVSASNKSTSSPLSLMLSVIFFATSGVLHMIFAGLHKSNLSVSHRKSSISSSFLPLNNRVPRPTACAYKLLTFVGLSMITQSMDGSSKPSVQSIELQITSYSPLANFSFVSSLSSLCPLTSCALKPRCISNCVNFLLVAISGKNTSVFLPLQYSIILSAIWSK